MPAHPLIRSGGIKTCLRGEHEARVAPGQPILSIAGADEELKLSVPTVTSALKHLANLGIARETTGRNYGRICAYDKYLKILS
jgi:hypothetical protein